MGSFKEIDDFFAKLTNEFMAKAIPDIISREAIKFFQERFTTKEWDGTPWPETKVPINRGTLMVRSGDLVNSIKEKSKSSVKVVISAGSDKVKYAQIHNEGGVIDHPGGTPYFISKKENKAVFVSKKRAFDWAQKSGRSLPVTKPHKIPIPMRRFMGFSERLKNVLFNAFREEFNKL